MSGLGNPIRVAWLSAMKPSHEMSLPPGSQLQEVDGTGTTPLTRSFDLLVIDVASFGSVEGLKQKYLEIAGAPGASVLVVVDTIDQETAVLEWLAAGDDVCRRDAVAQQLPFRIKRCLSRDAVGRKAATRDALTGLSNRQALEEYVSMFRASHDIDSPLCLMFLELDRFKEVNDRYGHAAGDQILAEIGRMLQRFALGAGPVARIGGDDFAVVVPGNVEQGGAFAEFVRSQIEAHRFAAGGDNAMSLTCSVGVASATAAVAFDELFQRAEQCLYTAKREGRNRVITDKGFDSFVDAAGEDALIADFENRIRVATERLTGELVLKARRMAGQYRAEADHDGLTGIFNRRYLDRLLPREMEKCRRGEKPLSIAMLDLDHFGKVNTAYGFPTGDRALKTAAAVIRQNLRAGDWLARYGGEEFCVVMLDTDLQTSFQVAERLRQALNSESITSYGGRQFQISGSFGVVEMAASDGDSVALFQRASDKVREAKSNGRNQVRL